MEIKKQKKVLTYLVVAISILLVIAFISVRPFSTTNISDVLTLQPIDPNPDLDGNVFLEWNEVYDANQYFVQMKKDAGEWGTIKNTQDFSFTKTGLTDGVYEFKVAAWHMTFLRIDFITWSNIESVTIDIPEPVPDAPILDDITPSVSYDGKISLDWEDVSGADRYVVFRKMGDGFYDILGNPITTNYYDDLVSDNGVYSYKVKAGNIYDKWSDFSNEASVTVQIPSIPEQPHMNQPTYEIIGDTIRVCIDWDEVDCNSYNLYRSIDGGSYNLIKDGLVSTSYFEDLTRVGMYAYKVSAVNDLGESEQSVCVTIEITEDGEPPEEPDEPDDYTLLYILLGVLAILIVPVVILIKKKK